MLTSKLKIIPMVLTVVLSSFLCACTQKTPNQSPENGKSAGEQGSEKFIYSARRVYEAAVNVYTGTLLSIELREEAVTNIHDTYAIKVKVNEVIKGDFQPGEIVEDLCPAGFSDLGCDYLFMTGVDPAYGYDSNTYQKADNVYSGKVLKKELYQPPTEELPALYKVTVEVQEVMKGFFEPGEIVEDITSGRLEEIRDDVVFMTAEDNAYLGQFRLESTQIVYNRGGNPYSMVKLPGDNRVEYCMSLNYPDNYKGYDWGIVPPKTQEELMRQIRTPLSNNSYKPFIPSTTDMPVYRCPCEYPDEVIESALEALTDSARDPAPVKESLYCKIHGVDNSLRFSNK